LLPTNKSSKENLSKKERARKAQSDTLPRIKETIENSCNA